MKNALSIILKKTHRPFFRFSILDFLNICNMHACMHLYLYSTCNKKNYFKVTCFKGENSKSSVIKNFNTS